LKTSLQKILADIEDCRQEMVQTASRTCFMDQEVIDISRKLDDLLNKYDSLSKK
jgi:predicted  nucleic acid-binding Zn-ribbon protein